MLCREIIAVCYEIHKSCSSSLCGNVEGVIAKPCVTGGHGWVQKGQALSSDIKMNCLCSITGAKVVLTGVTQNLGFLIFCGQVPSCIRNHIQEILSVRQRSLSRTTQNFAVRKLLENLSVAVYFGLTGPE